MSTTGIELTHSGVKMKGEWDEVCHFAKDFEDLIQEAEASDKTVNRYNNWRPRKDESQDDMRKKTVDEAKVDPSDVENGGFAKKVHRMEESNGRKSIKTKTSKAFRDIYIGSAKCFSRMEEVIYGKMMLKFNPYFFDEEDFSANLRFKGKRGCELNVNFNNERIRDKVRSMVEGSAWN